tara:strand:+ start:2057 stop:2782 length:726 start_codon:yes stop_codon:yes gene_type:complete
MSIVEKKARVGRFTSSKIHLLIKEGRAKDALFTAGGMTYIEEKADEKMLCRCGDMGISGRSAMWGLFMEQYVFNGFVSTEYKIMADEPVIYDDYLAGSTDLIVDGVKVSDIKCFEPKKFCKYVRMINAKDVERFKKDFPSEYWQLVSNAIINNVPNAEAIAFMPYEDELEEIQYLAANYDGADQYRYRFINESQKHELPYIPNESKMENYNAFEFVVSEEDKKHLLERVELAGAELEKLIK